MLSLTNPKTPHLVTGTQGWKAMKCNCKGYEQKRLCAHILAVSKLEGTLLHIVSKWKPNLSHQVNVAAPKQVGKKPGPKRKRHEPLQRDVNSFADRVNVSVPSRPTGPIEDKFSIVHLSNCKATTCYGCNGKFRKTNADPPPPPPWDIVLRRKEYRVYQAKGSDQLKVAARKEFVYYHVRKQCVLRKVDSIGANDILQVPDSIGRLHKHHLKREFGLSFP